MSNETPYFDRMDAKFQNDPDYIAHGIGLEVGEAIAKAMTERGLSYKDAGKLVGWGPRKIKYLLAETDKQRLVDIVCLAHALGLRMKVTLEAADESSAAEEETQ